MCFSDSIKRPLKYPTSIKRILQVSVRRDRHRPKGSMERRSAGTDTVSNVLIWYSQRYSTFSPMRNAQKRKREIREGEKVVTFHFVYRRVSGERTVIQVATLPFFPRVLRSKFVRRSPRFTVIPSSNILSKGEFNVAAAGGIFCLERRPRSPL